MVEGKSRFTSITRASTSSEWGILSSTRTPDIEQLYTIVAVIFDITIMELIGIKLQILSISLDNINANQCLRIFCSKAFQIEDVNLTIGAGFCCFKFNSILTNSL